VSHARTRRDGPAGSAVILRYGLWLEQRMAAGMPTTSVRRSSVGSSWWTRKVEGIGW